MKPKQKSTVLITEAELADHLGLSRSTLQKWRRKKVGPAFIRIAQNCVRYRREDVLAWIDSQQNQPTSARRKKALTRQVKFFFPSI